MPNIKQFFGKKQNDTLGNLFNEIFANQDIREQIFKHKESIIQEEFEQYLEENFDEIYNIEEHRSKYFDTGNVNYRVYFDNQGFQYEVYEVTDTEKYIPNGRLLYVDYGNISYIRCETNPEYLLKSFERYIMDDEF